MPSPRASPAVRPSSPLTPGYKTSHFETLQPPSPRQIHARPSNPQRRQQSNPLKLLALPRFHPANFPSQSSSLQPTPDGQSPNQPPLSPRSYQRLYSDAQKQLFLNQREMVSASMRTHNNKPSSPRLEPLGSPGPVTPLELEGQDGYLAAGAARSAGDKGTAEVLMGNMIRDELRRQNESSR